MANEDELNGISEALTEIAKAMNAQTEALIEHMALSRESLATIASGWQTARERDQIEIERKRVDLKIMEQIGAKAGGTVIGRFSEFGHTVIDKDGNVLPGYPPVIDPPNPVRYGK